MYYFTLNRLHSSRKRALPAAMMEAAGRQPAKWIVMTTRRWNDGRPVDDSDDVKLRVTTASVVVRKAAGLRGTFGRPTICGQVALSTWADTNVLGKAPIDGPAVAAKASVPTCDWGGGGFVWRPSMAI